VGKDEEVLDSDGRWCVNGLDCCISCMVGDGNKSAKRISSARIEQVSSQEATLRDGQVESYFGGGHCPRLVIARMARKRKE
jgi:hypothetical protein